MKTRTDVALSTLGWLSTEKEIDKAKTHANIKTVYYAQCFTLQKDIHLQVKAILYKRI